MTKLEIFNLALISAGTEILAKETDHNRNGDMCRSIYPMAAKTVLEQFPWTCALTWMELTQVAATDPEYNAHKTLEYQYERPADCIRVVSIGGDPEAPRKVERGYIYAGQDPCVLEYVADISEPANPGDDIPYAATLGDAIAQYMAWRIAPTVSPKMNVNMLWQNYQNALLLAMERDGLEHTQDEGEDFFVE